MPYIGAYLYIYIYIYKSGYIYGLYMNEGKRNGKNYYITGGLKDNKTTVGGQDYARA